MAKEAKITYGRVSVSVRYKSVLFPFEAYPFVKALPEHGYLLTDKIEAPPLGARIEVTGEIARKGDNSLRLDTAKGILAIHAGDPKTALSELTGMESVLKRDFGFDSEGKAYFYEILATASVRAGKNALEVWHGHFNQSQLLKEASTILGLDVSLFGARFCQQDAVPNQEDWIDVKITPALPSAVSHYDIEIVFRRSDRRQFAQFLEKIDSTLTNLMAAIDGRK